MTGLEKQIEKSIVNFLRKEGLLVEQQQGGKALIKKGPITYSMNLQTNGATDVYCLCKGHYIGIEVKKDLETIKHWLKIRDRYEGIGKPLPKPIPGKKYSLQGIIDQIKNGYLIQKNGGTFILTCELSEVKEFINNLK